MAKMHSFAVTGPTRKCCALGLGERLVGAVAVFPNDDRIAGLRFAQARGVPHIGISGGVTDMSPEVAAYMHRPHAAPVVLGVEWLVGAVTVPTLEFAKQFGRVDDIAIGALLDEQDTGGPATASALRELGCVFQGRRLHQPGRKLLLPPAPC